MSASNVPGTSASAASGGGSGGGPCGACKFLRRKCAAGCVFSPYFESEQGAAHFAAVHKVFGASNVSKLLLHIPVQKRLDAVVTICYEAQARLRDPVYGCVAHIFALQQQVVNLQAELSYLQTHLAAFQIPAPPPPLTPPPPALLSIADLPTFSAVPSTYHHDLSSIFDSTLHPTWTSNHQCREIDTCHFSTAAGAPPEGPSSSVGGLHELDAPPYIQNSRSNFEI